MQLGEPETPIGGLADASQISYGFFERAEKTARKALNNGNIEKTAKECKAMMSSKNKRSSCNLPSDVDTDEVPAMGNDGAFSEAGQTSQRSRTSST